MSLRHVPEWQRDTGEWDASVKRLAPTTDIFTSPCRCIAFNGEWASFISGVIERYTHPGAWLGDDSDKQRGTEAIEKLLASMASCDVVKDIRLVDGVLQIYVNGEWTTATGSADPLSTAIVGAPDLSGISEANRRCTVSQVFTDHAKNIIDAVTDGIDLGFSIMEAAAEFLAFAGFWGVIMASLFEVIQGAITFIAGEGAEWLDEDGWQDIRCALHCSLDEENPIVDESTLATWFVDIAALGPAGVVVADLLEQFGGWAALMESVGYGEDVPVSECSVCGDCEPWLYDIDLTASDGGMIDRVPEGYGDYDSGNGIKSEWSLRSAVWGQRLYKELDFDSSNIVDVTWYVNNPTDHNITADVAVILGHESTNDDTNTDFPAGTLTSKTITYGYSIENLFIIAAPPTLGSTDFIYLTRLVIRGTGDNPFV